MPGAELHNITGLSFSHVLRNNDHALGPPGGEEVRRSPPECQTNGRTVLAPHDRRRRVFPPHCSACHCLRQRKPPSVLASSGRRAGKPPQCWKDEFVETVHCAHRVAWKAENMAVARGCSVENGLSRLHVHAVKTYLGSQARDCTRYEVVLADRYASGQQDNVSAFGRAA